MVNFPAKWTDRWFRLDMNWNSYTPPDWWHVSEVELKRIIALGSEWMENTNLNPSARQLYATIVSMGDAEAQNFTLEDALGYVPDIPLPGAEIVYLGFNLDQSVSLATDVWILVALGVETAEVCVMASPTNSIYYKLMLKFESAVYDFIDYINKSTNGNINASEIAVSTSRYYTIQRGNSSQGPKALCFTTDPYSYKMMLTMTDKIIDYLGFITFHEDMRMVKEDWLALMINLNNDIVNQIKYYSEHNLEYVLMWFPNFPAGSDPGNVYGISYWVNQFKPQSSTPLNPIPPTIPFAPIDLIFPQSALIPLTAPTYPMMNINPSIQNLIPSDPFMEIKNQTKKESFWEWLFGIIQEVAAYLDFTPLMLEYSTLSMIPFGYLLKKSNKSILWILPVYGAWFGSGILWQSFKYWALNNPVIQQWLVDITIDEGYYGPDIRTLIRCAEVTGLGGLLYFLITKIENISPIIDIIGFEFIMPAKVGILIAMGAINALLILPKLITYDGIHLFPETVLYLWDWFDIPPVPEN